MRNSKLLWIAASLFLFITGLFAQNSTVVIAEVLYDSPFAFSETVLNDGEFISLYNYEEDDVNIGGWRVQVTDLMDAAQKTYTYTIPANTILQAFSLAVIAPYASGAFNIGNLYDSEDSDSSGNITLYTQDLVFPDTRSLIQIYDAQNNVQDELRYDGLTDSLPGEKLLRASNGYAPYRIGRRSVSIQRKIITIKDGIHAISRNDYHSGEETYVQLYSFLPEEYSFASSSKGPNTLFPENETLDGTVTKNQEKKASNITSSQVITGGKTVYLAEEKVVLEPGFEVKNGAEFELTVERDSFHVVPMLTFNLWGNHSKVSYATRANYIVQSNAAIVSIQEVRGASNFKTLKKKTGMDGKMCTTINAIFVKYGIGMLWDRNRVGSPRRIATATMKTPKVGSEKDSHRGWIVAEFPEFCFVATHLSQEESYRRKMVQKILNNNIVNDCKSDQKPIYIAGDMNNGPYSNVIKIFIDSGFQVLNDPNTVTCPKEGDKTGKKGSVIDLVLEYNYKENVYHRLIERGIPIPEEDRIKWMYTDKVSDHFPYFVKVKIK